jgi:hypothetical protein
MDPICVDIFRVLYLRTNLLTSSPGKCVLWQGGGTPYGKMKVTWSGHQPRTEYVHRVAYTLHHLYAFTDFRPTRQISHLCHTKLCVNISHLSHESRDINMDRNRCAFRGSCSRAHKDVYGTYANCILWICSLLTNTCPIHVCIIQGSHGQGNGMGIIIFLQGQGIDREFCNWSEKFEIV